MIPPPLFEPYPYEMQPDVINTTLPELVAMIGQDTGVNVIDNWTPLEGYDYTMDGCHPNDTGHAIIAANVVASIY